MVRPIEDATPASIRAGLARVRAKINDAAHASGRSADDVRVLAAIKYVDANTCADLVAAGITDLAENRLDALVDKQDANPHLTDARWHFIGRLQSRQAVQIAQRVQMVHTLCSASAAQRLARLEVVPELLVQVNIDADPAKDGLIAGDVERFLLDLPPRLQVAGLMTMPAFADDAERSRPAFSALRDLRDVLATNLDGRHRLSALSMGTSQDFTVAVEEGATHVRLGRILYVEEE